MEVIIERIENGMLILEMEDGTKAELPKKFIPNAKEGDVITFVIEQGKTESRKNEINERVNRLWKD